MLGFLANLRDMKSSLTSGMLVLFALWLGYGNFIADVQPDDSVAGNIRRLVEWLGPLPTLGLISFVAYFVGLVISSASLSRVFARVVYTFSGQHRRRLMLSRATQENLYQYVNDLLERAEVHHDLSNIADATVHRTQQEEATNGGYKRARRRESKAAREANDDMTRGLIHSSLVKAALDRMDILAVQLGAKRESAYNRFDKATSEAEFRYSLFAPTLTVAAVAGARLTKEGSITAAVLVLVGAAVAAVVMMYKATHKLQEANAEVIHGIIIGEIDVPQIDALKKLAERPRGFGRRS